MASPQRLLSLLSAVRRLAAPLVLVALALAFPAAALAQTAASVRVALVLGNSQYEFAPRLQNGASDARAVAGVLSRLGFTVIDGYDLRRTEVIDRISAFRGAAARADVALVFFAGHAVQSNAENWLLPIDARLQQASDLSRETVTFALLFESASRAKTRVFILDACRDNPFASLPGRPAIAAGAGLARPSVSDADTLIAFATSPGATAFDGPDFAEHSPFSKALVAYLGAPGLEIRQVFTRVRQDVVAMTGGQQTPWENSSLLSEVYLAGRSAIPGLRQAETAYWRTIESSDRLSDYTGFLDRFPSGDFAEIAADRIAALSRGSAAALRSMKECESCPEVVALPAASVVLGAAPNDAEKAPGEIVARRIDVAPFAIGRYQVTFAEWDACVADGGCRTRPDDSGFGRGRRPVINVSWADASAYAAWLSRKTRHRYRLPTEQEWEYAARAGAEGPRIWGGDAARACRFANVSDLNGEKKLRGNGKPHPCDDGFTFTSPVGSFEPNAFGLYDMIGNVWQWTADCWTPAAGGQPCGLRVLRGGSWMSDPSGARVTSRLRTEAADADINIGFRIARDLP